MMLESADELMLVGLGAAVGLNTSRLSVSLLARSSDLEGGSPTVVGWCEQLFFAAGLTYCCACAGVAETLLVMIIS